MTAPAPETPRTLAELLALKPADLERVDIARMNLLCAEGLPGAETLDVDSSLAALGQWADHAKREIDRHLYRFRANPGDYDRSEGYFRMLMMSVVVYEDCGIRYLKSLTAAEELSVFLSIRAACLMEAGRIPEAVSAYESALRLAPDWKGNHLLLADAQAKQARGWKPGPPPTEDIEAVVRWAEMNRRTGPDLVPDPNPVRRIMQP